MDFWELYYQMPVVTRTYVTLCVVTTAACALDVSGGTGLLICSTKVGVGRLLTALPASFCAAHHSIPHLL